MKRFFLAAAVAIMTLALSAPAAGVKDIKTVYLLSMSSGLDQFLAVQLTSGAVMQVVTDPQKADAVLTDHLGESFEQTMAELYKEKTDAAAKSDNSPDGAPRAFVRTGAAGSRARGNIFLVDRKSNEVVWSTYERPKDNTPQGLKRAAEKLSSRLAKAIKEN